MQSDGSAQNKDINLVERREIYSVRCYGFSCLFNVIIYNWHVKNFDE